MPFSVLYQPLCFFLKKVDNTLFMSLLWPKSLQSTRPTVWDMFNSLSVWVARVYRTLKVLQQYFSIKLLMCQPFQGMLQLHQELCLQNFPVMKSKSQEGDGSGSCRKLRSPVWGLSLTLKDGGTGQASGQASPFWANIKHNCSFIKAQRARGTVLITPEFAGRFGLWYCKSRGCREVDNQHLQQ